MKNYLTIVICTLGLTLFSQKATAQWDLLSGLLEQMDSTVHNQFFNHLDNLDSTWSVGNLENGFLLAELYDSLENENLGGILDSSYLDALNEGYILLNNGLLGSGLPGEDIDTILGQYGLLDSLFNANFDSLGGLYGQYQDSMVFEPGWTSITVIGLDSMLNDQFDVLLDTFGMVANTSFPQNPGNIAGLVGKLFNAVTFPDLELAYGQQFGDFKYYDEQYSANANVLRVGSVPRFNRKANSPASFPIEPRWHVEASFTSDKIPSSTANDFDTSDAEDENKLNPLLIRGDFAIMLTPEIGTYGNTSFRLVTSLGMEFGTYAPAHREYARPFTLGNRGFDTGFGPQAGVGFAMITGPLTIYSLNTVAEGTTVKSLRPYRYDSRRFELGVRYGNVINVRYITGKDSWQEDGNRTAHIRNQVTIGIILKELHP